MVLIFDPVEDRFEEAIRGRWISPIGWTVCCAWDLCYDCGPTSPMELVTALEEVSSQYRERGLEMLSKHGSGTIGGAEKHGKETGLPLYYRVYAHPTLSKVEPQDSPVHLPSRCLVVTGQRGGSPWHHHSQRVCEV